MLQERDRRSCAPPSDLIIPRARDARGRFVKPPLPSAAELLAEIADEIDRQEVAARPELPNPPLLSARCNLASNDVNGLDHPDAPCRVTSDNPAPSRSVDHIGISDVVPSYPGRVGVVAADRAPLVGVLKFEETLFTHLVQHEAADRARTIYARRQLEAAAEHGAALLAALGLPRLVGPDFRYVDIDTAGDALDRAIAALDAMDGDTDLEDGHDAEHDPADREDDETGDDVLDLGEFDEADDGPAWNSVSTLPAVEVAHV